MSRRSNLFGVGIVSSSLPAWADYTALPAGNFIEFTLNTPNDVGMQRSTLYNWCGGEFVPDFGVRGGVGMVGGGEHNNWTDSSTTGPGQQGVYVLDCDTRLYSRKCYPVTNHTGVTLSGSPTPTNDWGAYADDGSPQSKHTYNGVSYMPAAWGGGSGGSLMTIAKSGGLRQDTLNAGLSATWRFDLSSASHSAASPSIFRLTGNSTYNFGNGPNAAVNDAPFSCIDLMREGWWASVRDGTGWGTRMVFTSKTGVISTPVGPSSGNANYCTLHHFADDDIIVRLTDGPLDNAIETEWQVWLWRANTANAWVRAPLTRQNIADTRSAPNDTVKAYVQIGETQPRWSTILNAFIWLDAQYPTGGQPTTTIRVWKLTPPPAGQRFTGTWTATYELVTAKPGTESTNFMNMLNGNVAGDAGTVNNTFGRFVECPSLRAFVWTRDINKYGQLVRLQGM
jgi:hypothetical protein